jgi:hypothetical protein
VPHHSSPITHHSPRGSILIFAIVILSLLAMLGTMFLLIVRQCSQASSNALGQTEAELAAQSGMNHATAVLRSTVAKQVIVTPNGVFGQGPLSSPCHKTDGNPDVEGPPVVSYMRQFVGGTDNTDSALLSVDPADTAVANELRFTTAPLRVTAASNQEFCDQTTLTDRAYRFEVQGGTNSFYSNFPAGTKLSGRDLPRVASIRGEYAVWIDDLDAKLNAQPETWGIAPPLTNPADKATVQRNLLDWLNLYMQNELTVMFTSDDLDVIMAPPAQAYRSINDVALRLPSLETNDPDLRATLEYYMSVQLDEEKRVKPHPGAFNINTAPFEMIELALSQIPAYDPANPSSNAMTFGMKDHPGFLPTRYSLAYRLAKRIIAKRPFLCRMDFEDFAASLLVGDLGNTDTPVGAIKNSIVLRKDPAKADDWTELTLHQFLEMPGVNDPATAATYLPFIGAGKMTERFNFFANDDGVPAEARRGDALLEVREFNNLLNSLFNKGYVGTEIQTIAGDDRQATAPGGIGVVVIHPGADNVLNINKANLGNDDLLGEVLSLGPNGRLDCTLAGDDVLVQADGYVSPGPDNVLQTRPSGSPPPGADDVVVEAILAGPNGIADTSIFGYSYYSHDYTPQVYKPFRYDTTNASNPAVAGKFIYGLAPSYTTSRTDYKNYTIEDLARWSCVGDGRRSGYYDMFFNADDQMLFELGEGPDPMDTMASTDGIHAGGDDVLRTRDENDDVQEMTVGDTAIEDAVVVGPGLNDGIETITLGDDMMSQAIASKTLGQWPEASFALEGDDIDDGNYVLPGPNGVLDTVFDPEYDKIVSVVVTGPNLVADTDSVAGKEDDNTLFDGTNYTIDVGENKQLQTAVWGPVRASQRAQDVALPANQDQRPNAKATDGLRGDGDVAWSPQISFRSRFFGIYVLGRGVVRGSNMPEADPNDPLLRQGLKTVGERRLEAVYDAAKDQILWQRSPVSEKRALAE